MGVDRSDPTQPLMGVLIPLYDVTEAHITSTAGTDYGFADPRPDAAVVSAPTSLRLEATGTYDSPADAYEVQVIRAGAPDQVGSPGGVRFRTSSADDWHYGDAPSLLTGHLGIDTKGEDPSLVVVNDRDLLVSFGTSADISVDSRGPNESWGEAGGAGGAPVHLGVGPHCLCVLPDGSVLLYVLDSRLFVYRSDGDWSTWTLQHSDGLGTTVANATRIRACCDESGAVALFVTVSSDANAKTTQYVSSDGGSQFREVASMTGDMVWDCKLIGGLLHVVMGRHTETDPDGGGPNPPIVYRAHLLLRTGAAGVSAWIGDAIEITDDVLGPADWSGASIASDPTGRLYVAYDNDVAGIRCAYSDDGGETWTDDLSDVGPHVLPGSSKTPGYPSLVWTRGGFSLLYNDAGGATGLTAGYLAEARFGSYTNLPVSADLWASGVSGNVFRGWTYTALPFDTLANQGWTVIDIGTPTVSTDVTSGERVQTAAATSRTYVCDTAFTDGYAVDRVLVRVASGEARLYLFVAGHGIRVDVTPTQFRAYDATGAAPPYADHGIDMASVSAYIEIVRVLDGDTGIVYWREVNIEAPETDRRTYALLAALTSLGSSSATSVEQQIIVQAESDVYVLAPAVYGHNSTSRSSVLADNDFGADDLERVAIPLSLSPIYLAGSAYLQVVSGIPRRDGVTHTFPATGPYPPRNLFPSRSPSPRKVWRYDNDAGAEVFANTFTVALPTPFAPGIFGLYLDGLYGVTEVSVAFNGGAMAAGISNWLPLDYTRLSSGVVVLDDMVDFGWVRRDQMAGWTFIDSTGAALPIKGNTEGKLNTSSFEGPEKRATLNVPGVGASGEGIIIPSSVLLLAKLDGETEIETVTVTLKQQYSGTAFTKQECGLMALGEVQVFPVPADYNDSLILNDDARLAEMPDGSRTSSRLHRDRRRLTLQWVQSGHGEHQALNTSSPDYVTAYEGAPPLATWEAVPHIVRGAVESLAGRPGLWVPVIVRHSTADAILPVVSEPLWGRIVGGWRMEALPNIGPRLSRMWRVPTFTVEEEL